MRNNPSPEIILVPIATIAIALICVFLILGISSDDNFEAKAGECVKMKESVSNYAKLIIKTEEDTDKYITLQYQLTGSQRVEMGLYGLDRDDLSNSEKIPCKGLSELKASSDTLEQLRFHNLIKDYKRTLRKYSE